MRKGTWVVGAAFVAFSAAVALGWVQEVDSWMLWRSQDHTSGFLDAILSVFSLLGSVEVMGVTLLVVLAVLLFRGRRVLAGRLLAVFVVTGILELAIKLCLPHLQPPTKRSAYGVLCCARHNNYQVFLSERAYASGRYRSWGFVLPLKK